MKKNLFLLFAIFSLFGVTMTSCKDKENPEAPPVVEDVIAVYTDDKLNAEVDGKPMDANAKIELAQLSDNSLTIKLYNIVPDVKEFSIPNAKFEAVAKSAYLSKLTGTVSDNVAGYTVTFDGTVDEGVLNAKVTCEEIPGTLINTKDANIQPKTFKGEMGIYVSNIGNPITMEQRVYTSAPKDKNPSKMKIQINDFAFEGIKLGNIALDTITVVERGSLGGHPIYAFQAKGRELTLDIVGSVALDARGTIINGAMNLNLTVNAKSVGLTVDVVFNGNIVEESTDTDAKIIITGDGVLEVANDASSKNKFTLKVWESIPAQKLVLTPKVEIAEKATIDSVVLYNDKNVKVEMLQLNTAIDFSKLQKDYYIAYYVKSEDVRFSSTKKLYLERLPEAFKYDMQTWVTDAGNGKPTPEGLTNSNMASTFFPMFGINVPTPVVKAADNAAEITSSRTVSTTIPNVLIPGVTAGTLFTGVFSLDPTNTLKSTKFGLPYSKIPARLKVTYKYTPGTTFYKTIQKTSDGEPYNDTEIVANAKDACSINAYLYEVSSYDESLDGTDINKSTKVILKASIIDETSSSSYIEKEINFVPTGNGTYEPGKKYKIAIVCSSSDRGDQFMGADGSRLWIKYLEIIPQQ